VCCCEGSGKGGVDEDVGINGAKGRRPVAHVFNCRVAYCFKSLSASGRTPGPDTWTGAALDERFPPRSRSRIALRRKLPLKSGRRLTRCARPLSTLLGGAL
jgi:hypothetical protein